MLGRNTCISLLRFLYFKNEKISDVLALQLQGSGAMACPASVKLFSENEAFTEPAVSALQKSSELV